MKKFGCGVALVLVSMTVAVLSFQHYNVTTGAAVADTFGEIYGGGILLLIGVVAAVMLIARKYAKKNE